MKNIYLFLTNEDKTTLFKKAQQNQLSVSTLVGIICNEYLIYTEYKAKALEHFINRGDNMIHLHIKDTITNKGYKFTDKNYNNAIYMYLHHDKLNQIELEKGKTLADVVKVRQANTNIGRTIKKTFDPKFNYNQIKRQSYLALKTYYRKEITE